MSDQELKILQMIPAPSGLSYFYIGTDSGGSTYHEEVQIVAMALVNHSSKKEKFDIQFIEPVVLIGGEFYAVSDPISGVSGPGCIAPSGKWPADLL